MVTVEYPRVISRGPLKGRQFENGSEYNAALNELKGKKQVDDQWVFHLRLTAGSLSVEVSGDPRKPEDVDRLLSLLGDYGAK